MIGKRLAQRTLGISSFQVMELLRRAKELEQQGRNVIHMEIGESDFTTPQHVVDAGMRQIRTGEIKYTPAAGLPELRESIAGFYRQRYNIGVDPARIFVTPGATGAFLLALGASINPGEEVLMSDPCYPCNSNFVHLFDGHTRTIPVDAASRYQLTAGLIRQHWTPATKGALIASPSNPTGTLIEPQELKSAVQAVDDLGGCFYSDEIYHGLEYGEKSTTALEFSDEVFVINSFSKYFNMTGWRIGWLVAPDEFLGAIEKLAQNIFISTPAHSQYAALAAFEEPTLIELERRRKEFAKRRDFLYENLLRLGFAIPSKPEGAFYIYANCARFTDDSFKFAQDLLETEAVAITPGKDFGSHETNHYLRFAYTISIDKMALAIERLEKFINRKDN
jgi:aspartate/methionine/tyrosine aminotransferase